jgi:NADH-quinone oxidoreductase subunit M
MSRLHLITILTALPAFGALVVAGFDASNKRLARGVGLAFSLASLALALALWARFNPNVTELQFVEQHRWIPSLGVEYFVGVDGLGLLMVLLTGLLVPFSLLASWKIEEQPKFYFALVLLLESGLFGTFTALNFFHWFIFWELSLIPVFFLIKLWGGRERSRAATQFFIYTLVGSVAMLLAFQAIFLATRTFNFPELAQMAHDRRLANGLLKIGWLEMPPRLIALLVFLGVFLGFAVKVPLIPFHTWLPAAYAEAPTGVSMLLTGAMSKMGVYGFLRVLLPIFPEQTRAMLIPLMAMTVVTIVYSAWAALAQKDLKRTIAYSSINHLGYCLLGLFAALRETGPDPAWFNEKAAALNGVLLQMFNHGLSASALFCFIGLLAERSGGARGLDDFGGLRKVMPVFCGLMGIALFSSLGLPCLNGFIGEFLIFKGAFALSPLATAVATLGLLLTAIFLLNILQKVFSGPLNERWAQMPDLSVNERAMMIPVVALMLAIGLYPQLLLGVINPTVVEWIKQLYNYHV